MVALSPGSTFHGRYEVVRCLKAGGMGSIFEVVDLDTLRRRALKLMLPAAADNLDLRARFKLEATVAAGVESEHVVEIFDAGVDEETSAPFLVMELLRGEDLAAVLERRGTLPPGEVVGLLAQAASALDKTHAAGVVHRDLKPDNLFLTGRDDGSPKLKILDFGIAKVAAESGEPAAKTKVLGTPLYMSPEQVRGDGGIGPRADLYALAQVAFTLLVGRAYWALEHDTLPLYALMTKIVGGCPEPASERALCYGGATAPAFDAWFRRATHVVPEERFSAASSMVAALGEALGAASATPLGPPDPPPAGRPAALAGSPPKGPPGGPTTSGLETLETLERPEAALPTESQRTETDAPASMAVAAAPRKRPGVRTAGVAVAAVVAAVMVFTVRPSRHAPSAPGASGPPRPEAPLATSDGAVLPLAPVPGLVASPSPAVGPPAVASVPPSPAVGPPAVASAPPVPVGAPARGVSSRRVEVSLAKPAAAPSASAPPPAPAPQPAASEARPQRSLD